MEQADARRLAGSGQIEFGRGDAFAAAMRDARMPMIVTDPRRHDNPIVFVNAAFLKLTGYDCEDVTGAIAASCRAPPRARKPWPGCARRSATRSTSTSTC
ncbi:MAG TPA: PAS domain-containing protein [Methylobacterium sp.]|nr:PAS domain-containing protein [Methylobacterium sp.]